LALSAFGKAQALVRANELSYEELRVIAALGGTDFKRDGRHIYLL
jgi:hypothetical protein